MISNTPNHRDDPGRTSITRLFPLCEATRATDRTYAALVLLQIEEMCLPVDYHRTGRELPQVRIERYGLIYVSLHMIPG